MTGQRGFTLLEMLVALAIVAVALIAALRAMAGATFAAVDLRERSLADWVAQDRLAAHRIAPFPPLGRSEGRVRQGPQEFVWHSRVESTPNAQFRRIEVEVRAADSTHVLARASGFAVRPLR